MSVKECCMLGKMKLRTENDQFFVEGNNIPIQDCPFCGTRLEKEEIGEKA